MPFWKLPPDQFVRVYELQAAYRTPVFLVVYNLGLTLGFAAIYATRFRKNYYALRVWLFTMLLYGCCHGIS
jgi:hypothetical protein